jgi:hypothetical protein
VIDGVRVALTAVRAGAQPQKGDLVVVELSGVPNVLFGVDELRRPHMLLGLGGADLPQPRSDVVTLDIGFRELTLSGATQRFLDITCLFQSVADVFEHFAAAVAERVLATSDPAVALSQVLEKWRQFLTPSSGPFGRTKVAETFGELLVLRDILIADPAKRVDSWVGPFGGRHDFRRGGVGLEVKTTRAHTSRDVTIHGEDQLDAPEGGSLHLHFVRLEEVPSGGESLPAIVDDLLSAGAVADVLFEALTAAGVPVSELAEAADITFEVRERLTLVVDEMVPRIVPSTFIGGARPVGVLDLSYVISLDHLLDRRLDGSEYEQLIEQLATTL